MASKIGGRYLCTYNGLTTARKAGKLARLGSTHYELEANARV